MDGREQLSGLFVSYITVQLAYNVFSHGQILHGSNSSFAYIR